MKRLLPGELSTEDRGVHPDGSSLEQSPDVGFLPKKSKKQPHRSELLTYNHLIHPDNPYFNKPPDFGFLAKKFPYLEEFVGENDDKTVYFKWGKKNAIKWVASLLSLPRMLTKALLQNDFGIEWDMPDSHLAPTITLRISYLNWIHEILHLHPLYQNCDNADTLGIDIGTGASCIFPILGHSLYKWSFLGTDIDASSIASSQSIVEKNHCEQSINLLQRSTEQPLLTDIASHALKPITFCMCNPPFYASKEEVGVNPHIPKDATDMEIITPGGECEFISRIVRESLQLQRTILLYTSLVAKKHTLKPILRLLREANVPSIATPVMGQGRTLRWCICWSFDEQFERAFDANRTRYTVFGKRKENRKRHDVTFRFAGEESVVWERINAFCSACDGVQLCQEDGGVVCKVSNFEYHFPYGEGKGVNGPVCCTFAVKVEKDKDGCNVLFEVMEGDRKLFFTVAEQLMNDVQRTSRRWRRYNMKKMISVVCCTKQ